MVRATEDVARVADERDLPLVTAAYVVALERLSAAVDAQGTARTYNGG
jgi:glutamate dehydrogenase/leucine dehydrogenase